MKAADVPILKLDGVESEDVKVLGKHLTELDRTLNTNDDYRQIGTLFDFRLLVRSERVNKDGLDLVVNKFMVEGTQRYQILPTTTVIWPPTPNSHARTSSRPPRQHAPNSSKNTPPSATVTPAIFRLWNGYWKALGTGSRSCWNYAHGCRTWSSG